MYTRAIKKSSLFKLFKTFKMSIAQYYKGSEGDTPKQNPWEFLFEPLLAALLSPTKVTLRN